MKTKSKNKLYKTLRVIGFMVLLSGCTHYSFSGGSLPENIKSVQVVLFEDNTNRYDLKLSQEITNRITKEIEKQKLLTIDNSVSSDAKIFGTVTQYDETIISQTRDEVADERKISLSFKLVFYDRVKTKEIVSTTVSRTETYNASGGEAARKETLEKLLNSISEDAVLKLTSNW